VSDNCQTAFLAILEDAREEYGFCLIGYVLMPEHVHLVMSEPENGDPSVALQAPKQQVARQSRRTSACESYNKRGFQSQEGNPAERGIST
jgi:REP element-mobilizing transposase RayT